MLTEKPTPKTHPGIFDELAVSALRLYKDTKGGDFFKESAQQSYGQNPRDFTTAVAIKDKIDHDGEKSSLLRDIFAFLSLGVIGLTAIILPVSLVVGSYCIANAINDDSVIGGIFAVFIVVVAFALALISGAMGYKLAIEYTSAIDAGEPFSLREPKYTVISVSHSTLKKYGLSDSQHKVTVAINDIFSNSEESLNTVDLNSFARAYDEYMDMLVFVLANADELSDHLRDEYVEALNIKADKLTDEAHVICDIINMQEEFAHEAEQELTDFKARAALPPKA